VAFSQTSMRFMASVAQAQVSSKPSKRIVEAEEFRLVDSDGTPRALLTTHMGEKTKPEFEDKPGLYLLDADGHALFVLNLSDGRPHLSMISSDGIGKILMDVSKETGGARVRLQSGFGSNIDAGIPIEYGKAEPRNCSMVIRSDTGKVLWKAP